MEPTRYRKRPIVVTAVQWFPYGAPVDGVIWPVPPTDLTLLGELGESIDDPSGLGLIRTMEGPFIVRPGDFIVTGVKGERWPIKPDIFAQSYDPADDEFLMPMLWWQGAGVATLVLLGLDLARYLLGRPW